jgi:hypothetical protein
MTQLTKSDLLEFEAMVEANGPSMSSNSNDEIVFRGSNEDRVTIEYVRQPASDARAFAEIMENNPLHFRDAGFHAILPLAKSIEMHIRLLFLGDENKNFANNGFQLAKALNEMEKIISGKGQHTEPIIGFQEKKFQATGILWDKFCTDGMKNEKRRLIKTSRKIYKKGNPYRHNKVKSWNDIKTQYQSVIESFDKFIELFDEITE